MTDSRSEMTWRSRLDGDGEPMMKKTIAAVLLTILAVTGARGEWIPIDSLGSWPDGEISEGIYAGYGNGNGFLAYPEMHAPGQWPDSCNYFVTLIDLNTGHGVWTRPFFPPYEPSPLNYAFTGITPDSLIFLYILRINNLYSMVINWDGSVNRPFVSHFSRPFYNVGDAFIDPTGRMYTISDSMYSIHAVNGVELHYPYLTTPAREYRITTDWDRGIYIWLYYDNPTCYHMVIHISADGTMVGPTFVRDGYVDQVLSMTYSARYRKLFLFDAQVSPQTIVYSHEIDPDSLTLRETRILFQGPPSRRPAFASDYDTTWQIGSRYGYDSSGHYQELYRVLSCYTSGPEWIPLDTLPNSYFPYGITGRQHVIVRNAPDLTLLFDNHGVTRRIRTGVSQPDVHYALPLSNYSIFPNPTNGFVTLSGLSSYRGKIILRNILGREIEHWNRSMLQDAQSFHLPQSLPSGTYFFQFDPPLNNRISNHSVTILK